MCAEHRNRIPASPAKHESMPETGVLGSHNNCALAALSFHSSKGCRHWLEMGEDQDPRPLKYFDEKSSSHIVVPSDLPTAMDFPLALSPLFLTKYDIAVLLFYCHISHKTRWALLSSC